MVAALTLFSIVMASQFLPRGRTSTIEDDKAKTSNSSLVEIAKYRQWTLVNPTPVLMDSVAAISCFTRKEEDNPHETRYASVYVNPTGAATMVADTRPLPSFPEGSIIVKEKLRSPTSKTPEILTVMVKREQGYNRKSRDWEYLVLDGAASEILERGKLARCNRCHDNYIYTDFVTMSYLNPKPRR